MTAPTPDPEPISLDSERHVWRSNAGNCDAYLAAHDEWMRRGDAHE